jgi:ribosomal protein S18 acetylase RimI-like enzyme
MESPKFKVQLGTSEDILFLQEMLFEAAYWRSDQNRPSLEIGLARPDLVYLLAEWGRKGDTAVIAITQDNQKIGAAWYRFWTSGQHSYGFVAPEVPEIAIAVRKSFRGMRVGRSLIDKLMNTAASQGIQNLSLSVEVDNPALHLYQSHGFEPIKKTGKSWTMMMSTEKKNKS